jgi:hypothetical protein
VRGQAALAADLLAATICSSDDLSEGRDIQVGERVVERRSPGREDVDHRNVAEAFAQTRRLGDSLCRGHSAPGAAARTSAGCACRDLDVRSHLRRDTCIELTAVIADGGGVSRR